MRFGCLSIFHFKKLDTDTILAATEMLTVANYTGHSGCFRQAAETSVNQSVRLDLLIMNKAKPAGRDITCSNLDIMYENSIADLFF
jgi:hypothetical protein